ncbi:hypothetical protein [Actinomyces timonensis]|uniref:hypothetical protein n=1 Tax=Actinomyces timonensis TaxID=1288391 RepID=UPI0012B64DE9|nr:hypothetical protein [Actinomyces timonensis]
MTTPYPPQQPYASGQPLPGQPAYGPGYSPAPGNPPAAPGPGAPYGGYPAQQPMMLVPVPFAPAPIPAMRPGPARPGTVTAACVLAMISGGLGLLLGLFNIALSIDFSDNSDSTPLLSGLFLVYAFAVFSTAIALLTTGITFLKRSGYVILLGAAITQAVLTISRDLIIPLMPYDALGYHSSAAVPRSAEFNPYLAFELMVGVGLATATICLLALQASKDWRKQPPTSDFIQQDLSPTGV